MLRGLSLVGGSLLVAGILSFASGAQVSPNASKHPHEDQFIQAYAGVRTGMPASELDALGLDRANAERLSAMELIKRFIPRDKIAFNALNPAVKHCFLGPACIAYIFDDYAGHAVVLVQDGRVTWKSISTAAVATVILPRRLLGMWRSDQIALRAMG
jgi:hypothetical protein